MSETRQARLKRLNMRAWRRGMREVDLILGPFADAHLRSMDDGALRAFEALLEQNDQAIYGWITGAQVPPAEISAQVSKIVDFLSGQGRAKFN